MSVEQYGRKFLLSALNQEGKGVSIDEQFAVHFHINHGTFLFPHTADIRIYNLSDNLIQSFVKEYTAIEIQAGYEGNYGVIFQGTVKQVRKGRESSVDSYCDIFAADGDIMHNDTTVAETMYKGYTQRDVWTAVGRAAEGSGTTVAPLTFPPSTDNPSPRGKVMFGMLRETVRKFGATNNMLTTVSNGQLQAMPLYAYKPGDIIAVNAATGLVAVPEQTELGITFTCLLNPAIEWGSRIELDNSGITQNLVANPFDITAGAQPLPNAFPSLAANGIYKVLVADHIGDTLGNTWYTRCICVSLDATITQQQPYPRPPQLIELGVPGTF